MINGLLESILSPPDSPTADLYFRNACRDFLRDGVEQLGPTVFASTIQSHGGYDPDATHWYDRSKYLACNSGHQCGAQGG